MKLHEYDRAVCLCGPGRGPEFERTRRLLESKGVRVDALVNGPNSGQVPPIPWIGNEAEYSHFLAFRECVRSARDAGLRSQLIVEDDLDLVPEFDATLADAEVPGGWSLLYYGANHHWHPTEDAGRNVLRLHGSFCTHCLGIDRSAFTPILDLPEVGPTDWSLGVYLHHRLRCYAIWPSIALQLPGRSAMIGAKVDYGEQFKCKGKNHRGS